MFRRYRQRRSTNILFVIFRLSLSLIMFATLVGGIYSAYKHFSGLDPVKLDPQAIVLRIMSKNKDISDIVNKIPGIKGKLDVRSGKMEKEDGGLKLENLISNIQPRAASIASGDARQNSASKLAFKFLLVADSHSDNTNLRKAISQATKTQPDLKFIIGLGDYTEVGTTAEHKAAKNEFDSSGLRYFLTVGDHDLWDCRNRSLPPTCNFGEVFGPIFQSFTYDQFRLILLFNSDNYKGVGDDQLKWLSGELQKAKEEQMRGIFVFVHEPLYHPSSDHVMGRVEKNLKSEARILSHTLKDGGVKKIFAGDTHYFSEYVEPETNLPMVTVGAITIERNPQVPRYAVVTIFDDGSTKVDDIEIK